MLPGSLCDVNIVYQQLARGWIGELDYISHLVSVDSIDLEHGPQAGFVVKPKFRISDERKVRMTRKTMLDQLLQDAGPAAQTMVYCGLRRCDH